MTISLRAGLLVFLAVLLPVSLANRPVRSVWSDQDYIHSYDVVTPTLMPPSDHDGTYLEKMTIVLKLEKETLTLQLTKNKNILRPNFKFRVQQDDGEQLYEGKENCYYHGRVEEHPDWSVVISTCFGIRGTFGDYSIRNMTFFIEPLEEKVHGKHMVYQASELPDSHFTGKCGSEGHSNLTQNFLAPLSKDALRRMKRQSSSFFLELYVATDTAAYTARSRDRARLLNEIVEVVNHMDDFYNTFTAFKVRMALIEVQAYTTSDPITITSDSSATLSLWKEHFRNNIHQGIPADAALMFVGNGFANSVLGIAPVRAMCGSTNAGLSTLRTNPLASATTAAHELGHMFGLDHDGASCTCADRECIMSAVISSVPTQWSSCSQTMFASMFSSNNYGDRCLSDEPTFINTNNAVPYVCGNGIREPGEGCDCGTVQECDDPCCNATVCSLRAGALCYTHEACCQNCQYKPADTPCRAASGECDVEERCTGNSGECPTNLYRRDGINCTTGSERAYCIDGQCLSRASQCQRIYGDPAATSAPETCYSYNTRSDGGCFGKCGIQQPCTTSPCPTIPCAVEDQLCGIIRCITSVERPVSLSPGESYGSLTCPRAGNVLTRLFCRDNYPPELTDPAFVQDLTKCGENKVCMSQRCVDANFAASTCPRNAAGVECSGQGVCSQQGVCACDAGWAGAACDGVVPIASNTGSSAGAIAGGVIVALLVIAALVVAAVLIFIFLILPKLRAKNFQLPRTSPKASFRKPKQYTNGAALTSVPRSTKPAIAHPTDKSYNDGPVDRYHDYMAPPPPFEPSRRPAPEAPVRPAPNRPSRAPPSRPSPAPPSRPSAPPSFNQPAAFQPSAPAQPPAPKPSAPLLPSVGFKPEPKPLPAAKPSPKPPPAAKPTPKPPPATKPSPKPPTAAKPSPQPATKPVWPPPQNTPAAAPKPTPKPVWPPPQNPPAAAPKPSNKPVWPPPANNGSPANLPPGKKPMLPPNMR